jgi:phenylalanyl-tRNA synthetase alpha chain
MQEQLEQILQDARVEVPVIGSRADWEASKARYIGPKGRLTSIMKGMGQLPADQKPIVGKLINEVKKEVDALFQQRLDALENAELASRMGPAIDPSLRASRGPGRLHPLTAVKNHLCELLGKVGFAVTEGPEVETEYFCFDALNTPADHPARDAQDTYYFPERSSFANVSKAADERYLLRPHTSSVQIRTMLKGEPPIRIVSPGRCYRRDNADATHSANFHQIEGLYVDKNVTVKDLKALLDYLIQSLLGKKAEVRFRPHFFPYTEPSFEVDFSAKHLSKVGSKWIEIAGCGIVDPAVFRSVGYDPDKYSGYAFGMGIERIAMILYGIDDIRYFYQNDHRFLEQF